MKKYEPGTRIRADVLVTESSIRLTKTNKQYVDFNARTEEGFEFSGCKRWDCSTKPPRVILVDGTVEEFNGKPQIKVDGWQVSEKAPNDFQPKAPWPLDVEHLKSSFFESIADIEDSSADVEDRKLAAFTESFIHFWSTHRFPSLKECEPRFSDHPGARHNHHAYRHGLLEHTHEVMTHAHDIAHYHNIKGHEHSLMIAGAAIHDIGKLEEFDLVDGAYEYTTMGKAYGWFSNAHLYIGSQMLAMYCATNDLCLPEQDFLVLQNIILSHHGNWSDVKPKYLISQVVHCADMASAQTNRMRMNLANNPDEEIRKDSAYQSYLRIS